MATWCGASPGVGSALRPYKRNAGSADVSPSAIPLAPLQRTSAVPASPHSGAAARHVLVEDNATVLNDSGGMYISNCDQREDPAYAQSPDVAFRGCMSHPTQRCVFTPRPS